MGSVLNDSQATKSYNLKVNILESLRLPYYCPTNLTTKDCIMNFCFYINVDINVNDDNLNCKHCIILALD